MTTAPPGAAATAFAGFGPPPADGAEPPSMSADGVGPSEGLDDATPGGFDSPRVTSEELVGPATRFDDPATGVGVGVGEVARSVPSGAPGDGGTPATGAGAATGGPAGR